MLEGTNALSYNAATLMANVKSFVIAADINGRESIVNRKLDGSIYPG
jgi:hypothetical protein